MTKSWSLDGWSNERIKFPAKRQGGGRQSKKSPVLLLAWDPSSALTMGKLTSTWCSANKHCGALGKPPLLSGPHLHLKLVGCVTTWQFSKCKDFLQPSAMAKGKGEEAGLWGPLEPLPSVQSALCIHGFNQLNPITMQRADYTTLYYRRD